MEGALAEMRRFRELIDDPDPGNQRACLEMFRGSMDEQLEQTLGELAAETDGRKVSLMLVCGIDDEALRLLQTLAGPQFQLLSSSLSKGGGEEQAGYDAAAMDALSQGGDLFDGCCAVLCTMLTRGAPAHGARVAAKLHEALSALVQIIQERPQNSAVRQLLVAVYQGRRDLAEAVRVEHVHAICRDTNILYARALRCLPPILPCSLVMMRSSNVLYARARSALAAAAAAGARASPRRPAARAREVAWGAR